CQYAYLMPLTF
nr:immunoglobulin light chain junction region [Macaca mulatta]